VEVGLQREPPGVDEPIVGPGSDAAQGPAEPPSPAPAGARERPDAARRRWRAVLQPTGVLRSTRLRLGVALFVLLLAGAILESVLVGTTGELQLEAAVERALGQEIDEALRLLEDGRDPQTGRPFDRLERALDLYLARNVPSEQEAFVTFVDGDLHAAVLDRYVREDLPAPVLDTLAAFSAADGPPGGQLAGTFDQDGVEAHYQAVRVGLQDEQGAFAVIIAPEIELAQIASLQRLLRGVSLLVLLLITLCGWFLAGAVLKPVRELTEAARSISSPRELESITPTGSPEAVEMVRTFNEMLDRIAAYGDSQLEFLRAAGHELRTPLTVVTGHLEVLGDEEDRRQTMPLVLEELYRMAEIVREIESLAASIRPDFLSLSEVDLGELTDRLHLKASVLAPRRWDVEEAAQVTVTADPHRLTEAVLNLADNAVAHTQEGDEIVIGSRLDPPYFLLWVRDSGVGIEPAEQERIFEQFVRGAGSSRRYRGAGLGLAVVRAIARAHGGDVFVESRPGEGARFTLRLPVEPTA
jgi:two-component system, OmpR family, sensor kinase